MYNDNLRAKIRKAILKGIGRDPQDNFEILDIRKEKKEVDVKVTYSLAEKPLTVTVKV